jgi:hypothetical protein
VFGLVEGVGWLNPVGRHGNGPARNEDLKSSAAVRGPDKGLCIGVPIRGELRPVGERHNYSL